MHDHPQPKIEVEVESSSELEAEEGAAGLPNPRSAPRQIKRMRTANAHVPSLSERAGSFEECEDVASILLNLKQAVICSSSSSSLAPFDDFSDYNTSSQYPALNHDISHHKERHGSVASLDSNHLPGIEEEDEEYLLNDDDDDWFDSGASVKSTTFLKKAPSGTACIKHKRWKKRCPEDCPMRNGLSSTTMSEEEELQLAMDDPCSPFPSELMVGMDSESELGESDFDEEEAKESDEDSNHSDMASSDLQSPVANHHRKRMHNDILYSPPSFSSGLQKSKGRSGRSFISSSTIACERHTILHARCPPNCSGRRPARPHPRSKRRDSSDQEEQSPPPQPLQQEEAVIISVPQRRSTVKEDDYFYSFSSDEEFTIMPNSSMKKASSRSSKPLPQGDTAPIKRINSAKTNSIRNRSNGTNGRSSRKYLPSACDRHKILHARCPANCPERIARDEQLLSTHQLTESPQSPESISHQSSNCDENLNQGEEYL